MSDLSINLTRLRKMRGLTQEQAAEATGISRVAYRSIEKGEAEPRRGTLDKLAEALKVSVFDLMAPVPELKSLRFRATKKMTARETAEFEQLAYGVATWLQDFNELEEILEKRSGYLFERFEREADPVQTAAKARKFLGLDGDCDCVPDICDLLEGCGIKICFRTSVLKQFFGLSVGVADEGPVIAVNNEGSIPVERQIFSVAHELGHLLMHCDTYTDGVKVEPKNADTEREADLFASYFLMPDDRFNKIWEEYRGLHWVDRILHVKRHFKVSYKTVIRRLIDTNRADPKKVYFMFNGAFSKRYGKKLGSKEEPGVPFRLKDEPRHLDPLDMVEDRLSGLLRDALEAEEISVSRAAEIMDMPLSEMREFVQSWKVVD
jgi:Zn-dependent peptidase ImmA (M78 family)/transcriptional regulator with XRE-family HTH domain